jgi:NAD(P)-dependent dehydrogenase (short-subunit alcohol dehydrogenase family)
MAPLSTAVVTGAGSGVGRAVVLDLARRGWQVALLGRRPAALQTTLDLAGLDASLLAAYPVDIRRPNAVRAVARLILDRFGAVDALVNAAGTNCPNRALDCLADADYHELIDTNLHGAYYCTQAFLPHMRQRAAGTLVYIVSDAGKLASPKAGPAYVMSKFGLAGLAQSVNAEERARGIRACAIFPGDIDTPLLDKRPAPPDLAARARMLRPEDVAACVRFCLELPPHAIIEELVVRPR